MIWIAFWHLSQRGSCSLARTVKSFVFTIFKLSSFGQQIWRYVSGLELRGFCPIKRWKGAVAVAHNFFPLPAVTSNTTLLCCAHLTSSRLVSMNQNSRGRASSICPCGVKVKSNLRRFEYSVTIAFEALHIFIFPEFSTVYVVAPERSLSKRVSSLGWIDRECERLAVVDPFTIYIYTYCAVINILMLNTGLCATSDRLSRISTKIYDHTCSESLPIGEATLHWLSPTFRRGLPMDEVVVSCEACAYAAYDISWQLHISQRWTLFEPKSWARAMLPSQQAFEPQISSHIIYDTGCMLDKF